MQNDETPTGVLRDEHRLILKVAGVLERILDQGAGAEDLDFDSLDECVSFFRLFADACHHGKEEDLLFPELEARGMPRDDGPIAVMLDEHRRGRAFVRQMAASLEGSRGGDAPSLQALTQGGRGYIDLIRNHILKEDNVLFHMADRMVSAPGCRNLCEAYGVVCRRRFEGRTKEQLQELAGRLEEKYPAP